MEQIYLDNSATTKMIDSAIDAMLPHFKESFANSSSVYKIGKENKKEIEKARETIKSSIGANLAREIYFTSGGTEANNWVLKSFAKQNNHIITSTIEHHSVLNTLKFLERQGVSITYLPVDKNGFVKPENLEKAIKDDTALISIMLANNEIGTIQPIRELVNIANKHNILFHTDAVSALGHIPINIKQLGVDFLTISAHKAYGPKGIGALYARNGIEFDSFMHGGSQERGRRAGTESVPLIIGFAKALEICINDMALEEKKLRKITESFINKILFSIDGVSLNGDFSNRLANIVNLSFENINGEDLLIMLDREGFICSSGSACAAGSLEFSHVLTALGKYEDSGSLRISLGRFNKEDDLEKLIPVLIRIIQKLRSIVK